MTEKQQQIDTMVKMLVVAICVCLYSMGGMADFGGKWLRRFLMPIVYCSTAFYYTRNWRSILQCMLMFGTLSMGYGVNCKFAKLARLFIDNETVVKIFARGVFGAFNGLSFNVLNIVSKNYKSALISAIMAILAYVIIGVTNPFDSARIEESFLAMILCWNLITIRREQQEDENGRD